MDTSEKQKERHFILEKRQKIRKRLFPARVILFGVLFVGFVYGIKNHTFFEGWIKHLFIAVVIGLIATYLIEGFYGQYKQKK